MQNVFHISQLNKYVLDLNHLIGAEPVEVVENLICKEHHVKILDYMVKKLRNKSIPMVKVLWANHTSYEATWEMEEGMRSK